MARGKRALECSMARLTRLCVPGELHHVRVQGNNHQDIASAPEDFAHLHALWVRESDRHGVKVHAYVFLPNCVNVILSPTHALGLTGPEAEVTTTGGERLGVRLAEGRIYLKGAAQIVFEGSLDLRDLGF